MGYSAFPKVDAKWFWITFGILFIANIFYQLGSLLHLQWPEISFWSAFGISMSFITVEYIFKTAAFRFGFSNGLSTVQMQLTWLAMSTALAIPIDILMRRTATTKPKPIRSVKELFK